MIPLIKSIIMTLLISSLFGDRPYVVVLGIAQDGGALMPVAKRGVV